MLQSTTSSLQGLQLVQSMVHRPRDLTVIWPRRQMYGNDQVNNAGMLVRVIKAGIRTIEALLSKWGYNSQPMHIFRRYHSTN